MIWFVRDFDLLSVFLRAFSFALEALALGGVLFLLVCARPAGLHLEHRLRLRSTAAVFALALAAIQVVLLFITSAVLMSSSGMRLREVASAAFFVSGLIFTAAALGLATSLRLTKGLVLPPGCAAIALGASVSLSHAASRMDHRPLLIALTAAHHLGMAGWMGALAFLVFALRRTRDADVSRRMAHRFSAMAMLSVAALVLAGVWLAKFYAGSWQGMVGTSYGILLSAKVVLTGLMLLLGAGNFFLIRDGTASAARLRFHLRRFSEVELGLGLTVILAAASLTAQSPSVDEVPQDMLTRQDVVQRVEWRRPSFHTPALAQLAPPTSLSVAVKEATYTGGSVSDANDRAWSEYNHHWAGLIVLLAGALALLSRIPGQRWARHWPLLFLALSAFILLRADPECWPLGPRPFWASFTAPDVLQHRLYALLIAAFAAFEWGVQTGRLRWPRARFIFPALCAAGGALLLTHTHALGDGKDEVFAELSHTPIAVLGATAGWGRWLQLRFDDTGALRPTRIVRVAEWLWPLCLLLIGMLLLNYRES